MIKDIRFSESIFLFRDRNIDFYVSWDMGGVNYKLFPYGGETVYEWDAECIGSNDYVKFTKDVEWFTL